MAEDGITLENAQKFDAQVNKEYKVRYATGAHKMLSPLTPDEVRSEVQEISTKIEGKSIVSSLSSLSLFARSSENPEAILNAISGAADKFIKDEPNEYDDGTWKDVKTALELTKNGPLSNVAYLLWEETASKYEDIHGHIPQTAEEIKKFEEAKARAPKLKVS